MSDSTPPEPLAASIANPAGAPAPLSVRLKAVADEIARRDPDFAAVVERLVSRLADNGVGLAAPRPGEPMPDFVLPDETGRLHMLGDFLALGPTVVSLHRGHWCPYCRLSLDALARAEPRIVDLGAQIVAITPELRRYGAEMKAGAQAPFPMLSDIDGGYALELGLLFWVGDETREALRRLGVDLSLFQGSDAWTLPIPATFVVRQDGIVAARFIDPDYRRRMETDDLIAALALARQPTVA